MLKRINGTEYYYELHGKGHPVVLISGYSCDHTLWMPILDDLSKHYQVLIFDNRAVGQTKDNHEPLSLKSMAKDTIELAESLGLKKPHIIGQSMGGMIGQILGADFKERISKLVLLVTTQKLRQASLLGLRSVLSMAEAEMPLEQIFHAVISWVFGETFLSDPKVVKVLYNIMKNNPYPQSVEDLKRQSLLLNSFDGRELKIKAPTLVINGEEDILVLQEEGEKLARTHHAQFKLLKGAHGIIAESAEELVKEILHFFTELRH